MLQRRSTIDLLAAESTDPALRDRLELAAEILTYAESRGLPVGGAYGSYVETRQPYVIWNVFAAPALELALRTHCFPVAGCVSYRGFFQREHAARYAERLENEGMDVYLGGVRAYSTLGWFDDPLLDTFLFAEDEYLAALLFHELAHRVVYIPGDTRFNESFATAVERHLLRDWLMAQDQTWRFEQYERFASRQATVLALIEATRSQLRTLYQSGADEARMREQKAAIIAALKSAYEQHSRDWPLPRPYQDWMQGEINNARLETVADYHGWVQGMERYLAEHGLDGFLAKSAELADLDMEARTDQLASWQLM